MTDIIFHLVFAQIGKVEATAIKERAIIPLQQAIQATDHFPIQALQYPLGGRRCVIRRNWDGAHGEELLVQGRR